MARFARTHYRTQSNVLAWAVGLDASERGDDYTRDTQAALYPGNGYCVPVSVAHMLADDPHDVDEVAEWFRMVVPTLRETGRLRQGTYYGGSDSARNAAEACGLRGDLLRAEHTGSTVVESGWTWNGSFRRSHYRYRDGFPTLARWAREVAAEYPEGTRFLIRGTGHMASAVRTADGLDVFNMGARHRVDHALAIHPEG